MKRITEAFTCEDGCPYCLGTGHVCEGHPLEPWAGMVGDALGCPCGAAGMPCNPERRQA